MSRAFVNENDGWRRCAKYQEDCMMADENGNCVLDHCRQYSEKEKKEEKNLPTSKWIDECTRASLSKKVARFT